MSKKQTTAEICAEVAAGRGWEYEAVKNDLGDSTYSHWFKRGDQEFEFHKRGLGYSVYRLKTYSVTTGWKEIGGPSQSAFTTALDGKLKTLIGEALDSFSRYKIATYLVESMRRMIAEIEKSGTTARTELAQIETALADDLKEKAC